MGGKLKSIEGYININTYGTKMIVIKDNGFANIIVKFLDKHEYEVHTERRRFLQGEVTNPYDITLYGHGYIGDGKYKTYYYDENHKSNRTPQYMVWEGMLKRCYNEKYHQKEPTYIDCKVCDDWLNFQNFAKWYDENFYQVDNEKMHLDKDILFKHNKFYCPQTCVFVPHRINSLFSKSDAIRGGYPIGVHLNKKTGKFIAKCRLCDGTRKNKSLGSYNTPEEAFYIYKNFKENLIKQIANLYKDKIPNILYESLMSYQVEITD